MARRKLKFVYQPVDGGATGEEDGEAIEEAGRDLPSRRLGPPARTGPAVQASALPQVLRLRPYQQAAFLDRETGIECWLWGRQTGKSTTLAAWAVDRLITRPGRLVTILSNSRANGMELNLKCAEVCRKLQQLFEQQDLSIDHRFETMNYETRIKVHGQVGRIKVLAANPNTARGFSGDLILDEFAFHENSAAIWEAAEPILASNPDFLCRIASTPNGRHNMFYRLVTNPTIPLRKITRTAAAKDGLQIFHPITRAPISPEEARALSTDKRAYDQNYECSFESENMPLLTHDLISAAEAPNIGLICDTNWSEEALSFLQNLVARGSSPGSSIAWSAGPVSPAQSVVPNHTDSPILFPRSEYGMALLLEKEKARDQDRHSPNAMPRLYAGVDVGRVSDLTVITVLQKLGNSFLVRAMLRLRDLRLPDQQERLAAICRLHSLRRMAIDMTGLGLGLYEYTHQQFGPKIVGRNFSCSVPLKVGHAATAQRVRLPEALATQLLQLFEDRRIKHPIDEQLRDDLRKPERVVSPGGRVSIAAARDSNGHADHFWSLALAVDAALDQAGGEIQGLTPTSRNHIPRNYLL